PPLRDEFRELASLVPRGGGAHRDRLPLLPAEEPKRLVHERLARRGTLLLRPLAVERPVEVRRPVVVPRRETPGPLGDQGGLADPAPGDEGHDVRFRVRPRGVQLGDLSLAAEQLRGGMSEAAGRDLLLRVPYREQLRPVNRPDPRQELRPAVDLVPDILPGPDRDREPSSVLFREPPRRLLDLGVPRSGGGEEELAQGRLERRRRLALDLLTEDFPDLLVELRRRELRAQQPVLLLALDPDPAIPPLAEDVHACLRLTRASVLLRAALRPPDLLPEIEAERLESRRLVRRGPGFGVGHGASMISLKRDEGRSKQRPYETRSNWRPRGGAWRRIDRPFRPWNRISVP